MAMELPPLRRVVAAADASGKSTIVEDGPPPAVRPSVRPGFQSRNIWATFGSPAPLGDPDRSGEVKGLMPPRCGTVIKYIDFPPEPLDPEERNRIARDIERRRGPVGPETGLRRFPDSPIHPGMHETDTIDYAIVLFGEIHALVDEGETLLRAGDVLIHRGTNHAWSNRADEPCRVLFVLVDAGPKR